MASNYVYVGHQLWKCSKDQFRDVDEVISPNAINMFRHAVIDVGQPDAVHQLVSLLMKNLSRVIEPIIRFPQIQPQNSSSFLSSKIEPLSAHQKSNLQLEITNFAEAAIVDAKSQNCGAIQIRLVFKVRKEEKIVESAKRGRNDDDDDDDDDDDEVVECPICMDEVKDDSNALVTSCFHVFHGDCYFNWKMNNPTCPLCRSESPQTLSL